MVTVTVTSRSWFSAKEAVSIANTSHSTKSQAQHTVTVTGTVHRQSTQSQHNYTPHLVLGEGCVQHRKHKRPEAVPTPQQLLVP